MRFLRLLIALILKPKPPKDWAVLKWEYDDTGEQELHIIPRNDHIIHEIPSDHCPCGAHWTRENGVSIYRHASLDGREIGE